MTRVAMERNNRDVRMMIWMIDDMDDNGRRERKGDKSTSND